MEEGKRPPLPTRPSQTFTPTEENPTTKDPYLNDTSKHQDQDKDQDQHDHNQPDPNPPPPAYTPTVLIQNQTTHSAYRPSSILPKPVVIPRTSSPPPLPSVSNSILYLSKPLPLPPKKERKKKKKEKETLTKKTNQKHPTPYTAQSTGHSHGPTHPHSKATESPKPISWASSTASTKSGWRIRTCRLLAWAVRRHVSFPCCRCRLPRWGCMLRRSMGR